ncbi:MAG: hypothetical protein GF317_09815 [Candidatus Lokiarchaeota archaeon]|nr:hypothetical protein [Candidatus Lokiarchaeota archaeon]
MSAQNEERLAHIRKKIDGFITLIDDYYFLGEINDLIRLKAGDVSDNTYEQLLKISITRIEKSLTK